MHSLLEWGPAHLRDQRPDLQQPAPGHPAVTGDDARDEDRDRPDDN